MQPIMNPHYRRIGGDETLRRLVARFYQLMDEIPEAYAVRKLHPADLSASEEKLFLFLSGWLGGPQRYVEKFGHPRLRQRHLPFSIGVEERDQWMACMIQAMEDVGIDETTRRELTAAFLKTADFMRNRAPGSGG